VAAAAVLSFAPLTVHAETPLERGTYLMKSIAACGNCHTPQGPTGPVAGMELAGGLVIQDAAFTAVSANITPDVETGIGGWSDAQLVLAIREGKRPDGSTIGPIMPFGFYRQMSDEDVTAIVAYLRQTKPVKNKTAASKYSFPLPPAYGPPVGSVPAMPKADKIAYGRYLAGPVAHCMECHSRPGPTGGPDIAGGLGAGGMTFKGPWGESMAPNVTPVGLGHYSDAELKAIITTGTRPDGSKLLPPMAVPYYASMRDEDLGAIVAYLRSLPEK